MIERLFNDGWSFVKLPLGSTLQQAQAAAWQAVDLPHDFLIGQENNLYESCDGWYRRTLDVPQDACGNVWLLRFDGVYMDCDVLLNGVVIGTHRYGYTAFDAMLEGFRPGCNELMVHVRHQGPNSRWYAGAGIYRDVTLHVLPKRHIPLDGIYVSTSAQDDTWQMTISTQLTGPQGGEVLVHRLLDDSGAVVAQDSRPADGENCFSCLRVQHPALWSCDHPNLYTLETTLGDQVVRQRVGFRTLRMDADEGLFLNGEHIKLKGVCLHHDLGALGSAFHEKAARRQLTCMQRMGVNSLRTSHNPPARQVMDLCDEMGILVVSEAFDMWERPKNAWDYARFFNDEAAQDVASWVRRDRNHPSLLLWSIGNEIQDTHVSERGEEITRMLRDEVRRHDPMHNARVTIGSNYMPWEGAQRCADLVDAAGYNYGEKYYEQHHQRYPHWVIYGSETASALSSRGVYHFPAEASILSDEDLQCSCLGNSKTSWGTRDMRRCLVNDMNTPYSMGQYLWSGIDYIGEPTPYHTRSCYFGMADTACFPKEYWYLCRAIWTDEPMAHIGVHWDWNAGQMIDVAVMTTGDEAELLLNGRSLGKKQVDRSRWDQCLPMWQIPFEKGELKAIAWRKGEVIAEESRFTPGESRYIRIACEDAALKGDGHDMTFLTITVEDALGHPVENACDRMTVKVTGAGRLLGLDNGDSTDLDGWKTDARRLFSGKLLAMVGALDEAGILRVEVTSPGLEGAVVEIPILPAEAIPGVSCLERIAPSSVREERHARRIDLVPLGEQRLSPDHPSVAFAATALPDNAMPQEISYRVTNAMGIDTPCAELEVIPGGVIVHARGDGTVYLRATCRNGYAHTRVISQQEVFIAGFGQPDLDPYGFVSAGLNTFTHGEISPGNEQGIAFARDGVSMAGFDRVDFGPAGSDEMTLPIFALDSGEYNMDMWLGDPLDGGEKLCTLRYQKPSRWNVYQSETYRLPRRLKGMQTIAFSLDRKVHLKGFSFTRQSRAWQRLTGAEAEAVYGDSFRREGSAVLDIGNNVSLVYQHMDFGTARRVRLVLEGATPLAENPITLRFENEQGETLTAVAAFHGPGGTSQVFEMEVLPGMNTVAFVFLPGSQFDFHAFRFEKA